MDIDITKMFGTEPSFMKIAECYYDRNFGTISKSDMDLLMFTILYRGLTNLNEGEAPRDLALAKLLGITSQRVQNLREKMVFKYPDNGSKTWEEKIAELFKTPAFQMVNDKEVHAFIEDSMLRKEVEDFLKVNHFPIEYTLNKEVIILRKPAICALVYACCSNEDKSKIMKRMESETKKGEGEISASIRKHSWWNRFGQNALSEVWDICKQIIINVGSDVGTALILGTLST